MSEKKVAKNGRPVTYLFKNTTKQRRNVLLEELSVSHPHILHNGVNQVEDWQLYFGTDLENIFIETKLPTALSKPLLRGHICN